MWPRSTIPPRAACSRTTPAPYSFHPPLERTTATSCSCGETSSWRNRSARRRSSSRVTRSPSQRRRLSVSTRLRLRRLLLPAAFWFTKPTLAKSSTHLAGPLRERPRQSRQHPGASAGRSLSRWNDRGHGAPGSGTRQGIWLYDLQRGGETRFTSPDLPGSAPVWSPDGNLIAFGWSKDLYLKEVSSGLKEELLLENENLKTVSDWSRDGHYLIYTETDPQGRGDIWYLPDPLDKSSDHKPVKFQGTSAMESQGQLSPDGRWLAYTSNESGLFEIYVRPFPSGPGRWKISAGTRGGPRATLAA